MLFAPTLFGQATTHTLGDAVVASIVFGLIGIGLLIIGYYVFDLLARKLDVQQELAKGNLAVAIVVGALLFSIAYIAAHVVL